MSLGPFWVGDNPRADISIAVIPGDLVGLTDAQATLTKPDGSSVVLPAYISGTSVLVPWPDDAVVLDQAGAYVIQAVVSSSGATETLSPIGFTVQSRVEATWATVGDVKTVTGVDVDQTILNQAQAQVEMFSGALASDTSLTPTARDQHWLKLGVAYQAAWLSYQPDAFYRSDTETISQDGVSANFGKTGLILAPNAKKALNKLSWVGSRTVRTAPSYVSRGADYVEFLDDLGDWKRF